VSVFYLVVRVERLEVAAWKRVATSHADALNLAADCARPASRVLELLPLLAGVLRRAHPCEGLQLSVGRHSWFHAASAGDSRFPSVLLPVRYFLRDDPASETRL
jgi:hypothetical protein